MRQIGSRTAADYSVLGSLTFTGPLSKQEPSISFRELGPLLQKLVRFCILYVSESGVTASEA
jgi:hypothetical protein